MSNLRVFGGYRDLGYGTVPAAILSIFTDYVTKGLQTELSVASLRESTGATGEDVLDALKLLSAKGHLPVDTDWTTIGSIMVGAIGFGVSPVQGALNFEATDSPGGKKAKRKQTPLESEIEKVRSRHSVVGRDYFDVTSATWLDATVQEVVDGYKLTITEHSGEATHPRYTEVFGLIDAAWEFFDAFATSFKKELTGEEPEPSGPEVDTFTIHYHGSDIEVLAAKDHEHKDVTLTVKWAAGEGNEKVKKFPLKAYEAANRDEFVLAKFKKDIPKAAGFLT